MAESVEIGSAFLSIVPSFRGGGAALAAELGGAGALGGKTASKSFASNFKGGLTGVSKSLIGPALAVGAVAGITKLGGEFHKAFATIRVDSGATGTKLAGLEGDFKKLLSIRPDSMQDVSTAVGELNQRLGLSGPQLVRSGQQFLRLSSITKTDLSTNIEAASKLFTSFGISAADQGPKLDELFRASQATGTSVADLSTGLTNTGPVFRQLGLSFEESAGFLGILSKAGIDAGSVLPALSRTIATAAKSGKNAGDVFRDTFAAIKNAPSDTKAASAAIAVFGARAGPRFAALIREGKVSYGDLVAQIKGGKDTIEKAAVDTATFSGKFKVFKNQLAVAFEPVATKFFDSLTKSMANAGPTLTKVASVLGVVADHANVIVPVIGALAAGFVALKIATAAYSAATAVLNIATKIATGLQIAFNFVLDANPIGLVVIAIAALGVAVFLAYKRFKPFRAAVDATGRFFLRARDSISDFIDSIGGVRTLVIGLAISFAPLIALIAAIVIGFKLLAASGALKTFAKNAADAFRVVGAFIKIIVAEVQGVVRIVKAIFKGDWDEAWNAFKQTVAKVVPLVGTIIGGIGKIVLRSLKNIASLLIPKGIELLTGFLKGLVKFLPKITIFMALLPFVLLALLAKVGTILIPKAIEFLKGFLTGLVRKLPDIVSFIHGLPGRLLATLGSLALKFLPKGLELIRGLKDGAVTAFNNVVAFIKTIPGKIVSAVGNLANLLFQSGKDAIGGLIRGIRGGSGDLGGAVKQIVGGIVTAGRKRLQIQSPSKVMADEIGRFIPAGIALGMRQHEGVVIKESQRLTDLTASVSAAALRSQAGINVSGSSGSSRGVQFGDVHLHDGVDIDLLKRKMAFSNASGGF